MKHSFYIILLGLFSVFLNYSCAQETENERQELISYITEYAEQHPDGFTLNINTRQPETKGYAVEYLLPSTDIEYIVEHALAHENIVGGWKDPETMIFAYGSTKVFPEGEESEAIAFGIQNDQKAIYDLTNSRTIYIK